MRTLIQSGIRSVLRFFLHKVVLKAVGYPIRRRLAVFELATQSPQAVQEALLQDILRQQAQTAFARDHRFADARTLADYRRQVPVAPYDYLEPYITRVRKGETSALLSDARVHMFALTSGTTATRKYIPVNDAYLTRYKHGWNIWGLKVYRDHPEVKLRPIVQLSGDWDECRSEADIPCGAVTGLTAAMQKRIIRWLYCVPPCVGKVKDARAKYYLALRLSMPRQVGMILAANPSTLINMARAGDQEKELLIRDLYDGTLSQDLDIPPDVRQALARKIARKHPERARELEAIAERTGTLYPRDYWTQACLLGNWTGGSVGAYLRHYPRYYGDFPVRDVGLIASEGRMTIPFEDHSPAGVLDIASHYFEFIPEAEVDSPSPTVLGAHEVREGERYYILLTTAYGLYRYHIHDLVRVTGFFNRTPTIEFLSKGSLFSNLTGEKVSEYQVTQSMAEALRELDLTLSAYSVAPCWPSADGADDFEQPYYGLFLEENDIPAEAARRLAARLDERLHALNVEYASKRDSQRLGPIQVETVPAGFWQRWDGERLRRSGGALEQYKRPCLIGDTQVSAQLRQQRTPPVSLGSAP